jgi:pyruvate/2-oxoglutarate dehydrogenase complex dihydrolipoamide acyltransferase (E2) component
MSYAVEQDETEDRYHTQVEAGDVRLFTLDQLDAAFNAGLIHENTYVCLEGGDEWLTLGEVAGLGNEEPEPAPMPAPVPHRGGFAASPSVVPAAPYSVAPMVMPNSLRPVVNDLSFDDFDPDMVAMRPKRRAGKIVAGLAVVALGALGFVVVQSGGIKLPKLGVGGVGQASAASLSLAGTKETSPAPKAEAPTPAPEPAKPEPPKVDESKPTEAAAAATDSKESEAKTDKTKGDRLSEDMKAALLNKDKKQASEQKRKKATRGAVAAARPKPGKGSTGFKSGGSAYDPLNGKL